VFRERIYERGTGWTEWRYRKDQPEPTRGTTRSPGVLDRALKNGRVEGWKCIAELYGYSVKNLRVAYADDAAVRACIAKPDRAGSTPVLEAKKLLPLMWALHERRPGAAKKSAFATGRARAGRGQFA
jgi:hypothetical protein